MSTTNLPSIQREMIRYATSIYLVFGLIGNIFNCMMFTRRSYRRAPSSIYLLFLSIFSIIYLIWTISPLLYTLNNRDPQSQSVVYCKLRQYGSHTSGLLSRFAVVFACVDRFFITSTKARIRSFSSIKTAWIIICMMSLVCILIPLHMPILINLQDGVCGMFGTYKLFYAIYQIIVFSIAPPILMSIFSILAIRRLHRQRDVTHIYIRQNDRCLTRMVIAEVMVNIFTSIPYAMNLLYGALTYYVTNKSTQRIEIESFITFITQFLLYLLGVVPFYLFLLVSKPFRNECIGLLTRFWYKYIFKQTRINPSQDTLNQRQYNTSKV
ncbi:hypothetical protein I4U23_015522 [Adineta vaga]|nr:hypothetical protein I4U23_015522 [Adineta vaga]